jgi:hypothetical protein
VNATANNKFSHEKIGIDLRNAEPIVFMERGVSSSFSRTGNLILY